MFTFGRNPCSRSAGSRSSGIRRKRQYSREIKPIVDDPLVPGDFVMAAGAYDQRLYDIPSLGLTVVRNGPTGSNAFEDVPFLDRLLGESASR